MRLSSPPAWLLQICVNRARPATGSRFAPANFHFFRTRSDTTWSSVLRVSAPAVACSAAAAGVMPAQETPRQQRQDQRQERRGCRQPVRVQPAPATPAQGQGQVQYQDSRAPQTHKVKSVMGTKVSIQGGLAIGTVDDIIFDDDGYIDYLVVINEGKYVVVPWQAAKFNFEQRAASVNITQGSTSRCRHSPRRRGRHSTRTTSDAFTAITIWPARAAGRTAD